MRRKPLPLSVQCAIAAELRYLSMYNPYCYTIVFVY